MENKITSELIRIAKQLNKHKLNWAVGASTMLYLRGIDISVHDIDIMVSDEHFLLAHACLNDFSDEIDVEDSSIFKTSNFKRYTSNGIEIDLMSGMGIIHDSGLFDYRFKDFDGYLKLQDVNIPLCYVEDWYVFYHLMLNRSSTLRLIASYTIEHPLNKQRMNQLLNLSLPDSIRMIIENHINK